MTLHTYFNFFKLRANLSFNYFPRIEKKKKNPPSSKKTCTMQKIQKKREQIYPLTSSKKNLYRVKISKKRKNKYTLKKMC